MSTDGALFVVDGLYAKDGRGYHAAWIWSIKDAKWKREGKWRWGCWVVVEGWTVVVVG